MLNMSKKHVRETGAKAMSNYIQQVAKQAQGRWKYVLSANGINIPDNSQKHAPCPACGGSDRFRFDDKEGRGTWICNQCEPRAGDGLALIQNVKRCSTMEAAKLVADTLGEQLPFSDRNNRNHASQKEISTEHPVKALFNQTTQANHPYLQNKGYKTELVAVLPDGKAIIPLVTLKGEVRGAQTITPEGEKRLITGTKKVSAFALVGESIKHPSAVIIAEGYATGLAIKSISDDQTLVLAAIDAGNLIHVANVIRQAMPEVKIIIGADNDMRDDSNINTGKVEAEKAAYSVNGWVALPPTSTKADWDDYRQHNGIEATQTAFNASLYQPQSKPQTTPEIKNSSLSNNEHNKARIEERNGSLYWVKPTTNGNAVAESEEWVSDLLQVIGIGIDELEGERYLVLQWTPEGSNQPHTQALKMRDLGERDGWGLLRSRGLRFTSKSYLRGALADHLQLTGNRTMWAITSTAGWQNGGYIFPDGTVLGTPNKPTLFNGRTATKNAYQVMGTVQSWRDSVARLAQGNHSLMLSIACAFTAPLIGAIKADSFGVHLFGKSSVGKTTAAYVASSVYGEPEGLKLTWDATALGLSNEASAHNDGLMMIDEIGQSSKPKDAAKSAYALFNGIGKIQGAKEGGNRDLSRWRVMVLSTGEVDIETFINNAGGEKIKAGQLIRLLNIPINQTTHFHGLENGKAHADALHHAFKHHHGAVGRAWITQLANQKEEAKRVAIDINQKWLQELPSNASEQVKRVASRFALLETALALSTGLTGWTLEECQLAVRHGFNSWVAEYGMENRESRQAREQAEAFLNTYGYSRYEFHPDPIMGLNIRDLAGYVKRDKATDKLTFHTFPNVFRDEIAKGFNPQHFADLLAEIGMLDKPKKGYTKKTISVDGRQPHFYVLVYAMEEDE